MKLFRLFFVLFFVSTLSIGCGDDENEYNLGGNGSGNPSGTAGSGNSNNDGGNNSADVAAAIKRLEFPKTSSKNGSFVVVHNALLNAKTNERGVNYSVEWDPVIHAQRWCCYQMYGKVVNGVMQGTNGEYTTRYVSKDNQYPNDPDIDKQYQFTSDPFWNSGYDHGHICPSADRLGSEMANYQTFYLTNMMPQVNSFNAGVWSSMEGKLRDWSKTFDTLYVCKGGTIDNEQYIINYLGSGDNKIPIPKYFFMAVLGKNSMGYTAMAFWIEHSGKISKSSNLNNYLINVRELEKKTNIDFFCNLPDDTEEWVETLPVETLKATWVIK